MSYAFAQVVDEKDLRSGKIGVVCGMEHNDIELIFADGTKEHYSAWDLRGVKSSELDVNWEMLIEKNFTFSSEVSDEVSDKVNVIQSLKSSGWIVYVRFDMTEMNIRFNATDPNCKFKFTDMDSLKAKVAESDARFVSQRELTPGVFHEVFEMCADDSKDSFLAAVWRTTIAGPSKC